MDHSRVRFSLPQGLRPFLRTIASSLWGKLRPFDYLSSISYHIPDLRVSGYLPRILEIGCRSRAKAGLIPLAVVTVASGKDGRNHINLS
jgi:hypothetical protein